MSANTQQEIFMTEFINDTSTATRVEKTKRFLRHLSEPDGVYFFNDGYPRENDLQNDARAALEVFEEMARVQAAQTERRNGRLNVSLEVALQSLEQIANTPRNRGAKRNAKATLLFLESQRPS